jgi:hypothetical protein
MGKKIHVSRMSFYMISEKGVSVFRILRAPFLTFFEESSKHKNPAKL